MHPYSIEIFLQSFFMGYSFFILVTFQGKCQNNVSYIYDIIVYTD
jgi:hypothetical protein